MRYDTFEETAAQMNWYQNMVKVGSGLAWKMISRQTGEAMGVISVYAYKPEHRKAEIGFWLLPQFWNKGFATEAIKAVIQYWKTEKALHRLEAFVEVGNGASASLLSKAGFLYEGTMHDCEIKNGKFISLQIYALLFGESDS